MSHLKNFQPILTDRDWSLPNVEEHMIFGAEVPVGVSIEVGRRAVVKCFQPVGGVNVAQPLLERHLILEKSENGFNIINW